MLVVSKQQLVYRSTGSQKASSALYVLYYSRDLSTNSVLTVKYNRDVWNDIHKTRVSSFLYSSLARRRSTLYHDASLHRLFTATYVLFTGLEQH